MSKIVKYLKSIFLPLFLGSIVGLIISNSIDYDSLIKPPFSPPSIVFPIAWTIIYFLMGLSYAIISSNIDSKTQNIYYLQLIVNLIWPIIFFTFKYRLLSLFWIILLIVLIIIMITKFYNKNKYAAFLQIPYLLWTFFATYLNLSIYLLNK